MIDKPRNCGVFWSEPNPFAKRPGKEKNAGEFKFFDKQPANRKLNTGDEY